MTEKEVLFTKFFNDNFKIKFENNLYTPIDYCRERNFGKHGISGWISRLINFPEKEITKKYNDIETTILLPNGNGGGSIEYDCKYLKFDSVTFNHWYDTTNLPI
ncbi:uncharacterized protein LOC132943725 [Metopolophium dirhodum]|uniref:uncharacterized protein LOC132943725 n=1 Tax=Metopolophium dirhodum TaxID=44670 RepID=UPI00299067A8|nr:uncharacterized protein LOC132943725 [Metopolophium dirhodum]